MKNIKTKYLLGLFAIATLFGGVFSSCSNDDNASTTAPLAITSVSKAVSGDLTAVNFGYANNMYIIAGSGFTTVEKVYFNDTDTYFNPTLVTDSALFVTIDINTPYANASNELKIVTKNGTVVYPFIIAPPAPLILKGFNPINANTGDVITIYGNFFLNPVVTIGTTQVPIISTSLTEIKVAVPANSDKKYVTVTTISGSAVSTDAIGTAIYDDVFYGIDGTNGWGISNLLIDNTVAADVAQGTKAIKVDITSWSGFQIDMWANGGHPVPTGATGIKFKMKLKADARIRVIVGGDWGHEVWFDVKTGYDTFVVRWSDLGLSAAPATVGQLVFGSDGVNTTFYIDDLGFKL